MYRGKDIENREKLVETCLRIFERGDEKELFEILPHISIVRSPSFVGPLLRLLKEGNRDQKEFAALALGSLADARCIEPLYAAFAETAETKGSGSQSLQTAIVVALGESGSDLAVDSLMSIYNFRVKNDSFGLRRRRLVLSALGALAQQGCARGEQELVRFMESQNPTIRAQAVIELSVAYWHRPNEISTEILEQMRSLVEDRSSTVRNAALSSLTNLADLGCRAAANYFKETDE